MVSAMCERREAMSFSNPKAYRPIALLNCLGKVLEKLMASRLSHMAETMGLLHPDQMGGRPRRSAIDAALALTYETETAMMRNRVASMLLMDVRGAFDNVNSLRLCNTMTEWGVPKVVIHVAGDPGVRVVLVELVKEGSDVEEKEDWRDG